MSQASKSLKKIASSEEYKVLDEAVKARDYPKVADSYLKVSQLLESEKKQILEKIEALPRLNKAEDLEQFQSAFTVRSAASLPQWHWLNQQLKEQGVMEGEVFGLGSRGDPLVRTAQGRVVVISGSKVEKGTRVKFRVVTPGQKLDFGRVIELNPEYFCFLLNHEARDNMKKSFEAVEERLRNGPVRLDDEGVADLTRLLQGLEDARQLTSKLDALDRDGAVARVQTYRKRLLNDCGVDLAFEHMAKREEKEIAEVCGGDSQQMVIALSAAGLFRYESHRAIKEELLAGKELKGYSETLKGLQSNLNSMSAAIELMEFQSGVEKISPQAKTYLERMDEFFDRLRRKAKQVTFTVAEGTSCRGEDVRSAVLDGFSPESLCFELRRSFRSAEEFFSLRGALVDLRGRLDGKASLPAEAAVRPYISRIISASFESARPLARGK